MLLSFNPQHELLHRPTDASGSALALLCVRFSLSFMVSVIDGPPWLLYSRRLVRTIVVIVGLVHQVPLSKGFDEQRARSVELLEACHFTADMLSAGIASNREGDCSADEQL